MALELDDDYATIEAAMALIDEWEMDMRDRDTVLSPVASESCESDSNSTSTTPATDSDDTSIQTHEKASRRRKAPSIGDSENAPRSVPTQVRRREELVFLRGKVREMEAELAALKDAKVEPKVDDQASQQPSMELSPHWVWQQIAARQLESRNKSELENLKLRVQVEEQIKIAKDVMRVLMRAYQRERDDRERDDSSKIKRMKLPRDALAEVTEEDQVQRLAELYAESDVTFAAAPFTGGPPVFRDIQIATHETGESTINVETSWAVPFPVDQVMSAFWSHLMRKSGPQDCGPDRVTCPFVDDGQDLLSIRFESNPSATKLMGKFLGRFVARRFLSEDGGPNKIAWDSCLEPVDFKPMSMEGVRVHNETILRVVWPDEAAGESGASASAERSMSLIQLSQRTHVQLAGSETPTRRRRIGALTDFMLYSVESELTWKQHVLETLLLRAGSPPPKPDGYIPTK